VGRWKIVREEGKLSNSIFLRDLGTITFVIPTLNCKEELLERLCQLRQDFPYATFIVVDDLSKDGTWYYAKQRGCFVPYTFKKRGYGKSLIEGLCLAWFSLESDYVVQMDVDHTADIKRFLEFMKEHDLDLLVGWEKSASSKFREYARRFACWLTRTFLGLRSVHHPTCGLRVWRGEACQFIPWRRIKSKGFGVQIETLFWAERRGLRIGELEFEGHKQKERLGLRVIFDWLLTWFRLLRLRIWLMIWEKIKPT